MSLLQYYCQRYENARNVVKNFKIEQVIFVLKNVQKAVSKTRLQLFLFQ